MPLATQLLASSTLRPSSHTQRSSPSPASSNDPSNATSNSDQSFSDAFHAARQATHTPDPKSASSTPHPKSSDTTTDPHTDSSDTTTNTTPLATDPSSTSTTPATPPDTSPAKNPPTIKLPDSSPSPAADVALQAAITTLLPTPIPLPTPPTPSTDAPLLSASLATTNPTLETKIQPHSPKLAKTSNPLKQSQSLTAPAPAPTPSTTPSAETLTTSLPPNPAPDTDPDADPNTPNNSDPSTHSSKNALSTKQDPNALQTTTTPNQSQSALLDAAALAATSSDPTPATKPSIPTLESPDPTPRTDPSSSLAATSTTPLTSHSSHAESASSAQDLPRTDPSQTYDQIVLGLRTKLDPQNGKAEIHLNPPNLGSVHISIHLANGSLTAQFHSQSDVVRDLLKSNMDKLKTVLQNQGIAVDKLAVNSVANSAQSSPDRDPQSGSAPHDGRSAGHSQQDPSNQNRSAKDPNSNPNTNSFARAWRNATNDTAPIDLVA